MAKIETCDLCGAETGVMGTHIKIHPDGSRTWLMLRESLTFCLERQLATKDSALRNARDAMSAAAGWEEHRCLYDIGVDDGKGDHSPSTLALKIIDKLTSTMSEIDELLGEE